MPVISSTSDAVPMLEIQYTPIGRVILPAQLSHLQQHHTMPKYMLCQHTAGFSQVDESFSKRFSLMSAQTEE